MNKFNLSFERAEQLAESLASWIITDFELCIKNSLTDEMFSNALSRRKYIQEFYKFGMGDILINVRKMAALLVKHKNNGNNYLIIDENTLALIADSTPAYIETDTEYETEKSYKDEVSIDSSGMAVNMHRQVNLSINTNYGHNLLYDVGFSEASRGLFNSLKKFIIARLVSQRKTKGSRPNRSQTTHNERPDRLCVRVSCQNMGLRIHAAPCYFIKWHFFGAPSSPVRGWLKPGLYIFAGDDGTQSNLVVDNGLFSIPPDFDVQLMRF